MRWQGEACGAGGLVRIREARMILKPTKSPIHIFSIIYLMRIRDMGQNLGRIRQVIDFQEEIGALAVFDRTPRSARIDG